MKQASKPAVMNSVCFTYTRDGTGGGFGSCPPDRFDCLDPQSIEPKLFSNLFMSQTSNNNTCSGDLAPPAGFNKNYDIIREANRTRIFRQEIEAKAFTPDFVKDAQKLFYFGLMMAPKSFYDLKTNSEWLSSQEAGNYNYGYLGAAMGIQQETLLQLSGMVQYASDIVSSGGDYPYVYNLGKGILDGDFGQFDNLPEDPEEIIAGYQAHEDGCKPDTSASNTPTSSSGSSIGGGWSPSLRIFLGVSGCVGNCDIPSGTVTVTDLDPE